jgi:hypothetical protein
LHKKTEYGKVILPNFVLQALAGLLEAHAQTILRNTTQNFKVSCFDLFIQSLQASTARKKSGAEEAYGKNSVPVHFDQFIHIKTACIIQLVSGYIFSSVGKSLSIQDILGKIYDQITELLRLYVSGTVQGINDIVLLRVRHQVFSIH